MQPDLVNLPSNKDELLCSVLSSTGSRSLIGSLRWEYANCAGYGFGVNRQVTDRVAEWIQENWNWLVNDHHFEKHGNKESLVIKFTCTGISIGNYWSVPRYSPSRSEAALYIFAKTK
jgi:hypothetical protein